MCLAVPGKIINVSGQDELRAGDVSFAGVVKRVNLAYVPEARIGDHVMVHVGFAISVVDESEARSTLEYLQTMGELAELETES